MTSLQKTISAGNPPALLPLLFLALLAVSTPMHGANLVVNGSFENTGSTSTSFRIGSDANLPDWTVVPNNSTDNLVCLAYAGLTDNMCGTTRYDKAKIAVWQHPGASPDGGNFLLMDGETIYNGPLTQVLNGMTIGQTYAVKFWQAAGQQNTQDGATTEKWQVSLGSETQYSTVMNTPEHGKTDWMRETLYFTANASSATLKFLAFGTPLGVPPMSFLDGVSVDVGVRPPPVTPPVSNVPEPGGFFLIGLGLLGLPIATRRIRNRLK